MKLAYFVTLAFALALHSLPARADSIGSSSQGVGMAGATGNAQSLIQIAPPAPSHVRIDSTPSVVMPGITGGTNSCTHSVAAGSGVTGILASFGFSWSGDDCKDRNWYLMQLEAAKYAHVMGEKQEAALFMAAAKTIACTSDQLKDRLPPGMCNSPQAPVAPIASTPQVPVQATASTPAPVKVANASERPAICDSIKDPQERHQWSLVCGFRDSPVKVVARQHKKK